MGSIGTLEIRLFYHSRGIYVTLKRTSYELIILDRFHTTFGGVGRMDSNGYLRNKNVYTLSLSAGVTLGGGGKLTGTLWN